MDALGAVALLGTLPVERTRLLDNLGLLRRAAGGVTPELADALADHMGIPRGEVAETASAYHYLGLPLDCLRVCTGPVCDAAGARALLGLARERSPEGLPVVEVPCLGHCDCAPAATRGDAVVPQLTRELLDAVLAGDVPPPVRHRGGPGASIDLTFAEDGPGDLAVLHAGLSPEQVLAELRASGLAGCGGAAFPAWRKWEAVLAGPGPRAVVVNGDEGEPGTFKDRYVMELRPHLLLEGLLLAMRAVDAGEAWVYVREEYATARARLEEAIAGLAAAGVLEGRRIELVRGAGSYVCGEETALLESLEGRRGMPRLRPPFPAQSGLLARPTLVHNVETLAHVPAVLRLGGEAWAALGTRGVPGVRLYSVSGAVAAPGCFEAPAGITVGDALRLAGGPDGELGCVVPGGAASGILPPESLLTPLTAEGLARFGCSVGSAAVQAFRRSYPVIRLLERTTAFFAEESCQKCTPCRIGTRALHDVAQQLARGRSPLSRTRLAEWMDVMERGSICGLGQGAPLPLRNAMARWPELFEPLDRVAT